MSSGPASHHPSFKGKVALITGGTSGIGEATALELAGRGTHVVLTGRRDAEGQAVASAVKARGVQGLFVKGDVTREADLQRAIDAALKLTGRIDFAFNNAGIEEPMGPLHEKSVDTYRQVFDINVLGVFLSMKLEIAQMLRQGGGSIVNTGSIASSVGMPGATIYVASKHAVAGFTRSAALEYAKQNIRINLISPAAIQTPMMDRFATDPGVREFLKNLHPIGRVGTPEEIARAVAWLLGDESSFVLGADLRADGGFTAA